MIYAGKQGFFGLTNSSNPKKTKEKKKENKKKSQDRLKCVHYQGVKATGSLDT